MLSFFLYFFATEVSTSPPTDSPTKNIVKVNATYPMALSTFHLGLQGTPKYRGNLRVVDVKENCRQNAGEEHDKRRLNRVDVVY